MLRKTELLKLARLLRSQAEGRGSSKRNLRKLADYYDREAKRLPDRPDVKRADRAA
jgi:hypothetical protein